MRTVRLYDDPAQATVDGMIGALRGAITPRTKALALTWVHSGTGVKLPVQELGDVRPLVVLDGVHALAVETEPVPDVSDVFVAGTHKWLGGPRGTGVVWTRDWEGIQPTIPSFSMSGDPGPRFTPGGYHSFEHRWALAQAFEHQSGLGREAVAEHVHGLAQRLKDGLAELRGVRLITPRDAAVSSGIVCFEVEGMDPQTAVDRLAETGSGPR